MKVVYAVATYYPQKNGVQSVTQKQAESLVKAGIDVVVVCGYKNNNPQEEYHNGVKILRVNAFNKFVLNRGDKAKFVSLIKKECMDADALITVCMGSFATNWMLDELHNISCKKILYLHGIANFEKINIKQFGVADYLYRISKRLYWKIFYNFKWNRILLYDAIVHIHEHDGSLAYITKRGYKNNYVIYNAIENEMFKAESNYADKDYFINVANYLPNKNQIFLLESFYRANLSSGLVLIGSEDNEYYEKLTLLNEKLENQYGKKDVQILHHISREETVRYIKSALAVVLTSKMEKFPMTIIEAMAAGKPFISSDVGVVKHLPGGLVYKDQSNLIELLQKVEKDKEYRVLLGQQGYEFAKNELALEKHVEKMLNLFKCV